MLVWGMALNIRLASKLSGRPLLTRSVGTASVEGKLPLLVARSNRSACLSRVAVTARPTSNPVTPSGSVGGSGL